MELMDEELAKANGVSPHGFFQNTECCSRCRKIILGTVLKCGDCGTIWCTVDCRMVDMLLTHPDTCAFRHKLFHEELTHSEIHNYRRKYGKLLPPPPVPHYKIGDQEILAHDTTELPSPNTLRHITTPKEHTAAMVRHLAAKYKVTETEILIENAVADAFYSHPCQRYASYHVPLLGFMVPHRLVGPILLLYSVDD